MEQITVSVPVARHVLWHFGDTNLGQQPGSFVERLLSTISAADLTNRELLRRGFPEYVDAFVAVQGEHWGLEWLRDKVKAALDGDPEPTLVPLRLV